MIASMLKRNWRKWLIGFAIAGVILLGVRECFRQFVYASFGFCLEGEFTTLPVDDKALCEWMKTQPHVYPYNVAVCRVGPDGKTVRVSFIQARNLAGHPPLPDLDGACEALGYAGPKGNFGRSNEPGCQCVPCE